MFDDKMMECLTRWKLDAQAVKEIMEILEQATDAAVEWGERSAQQE